MPPGAWWRNTSRPNSPPSRGTGRPILPARALPAAVGVTLVTYFVVYALLFTVLMDAVLARPHCQQIVFAAGIFYIAPLPLGAILAFLMLIRSLRKGHEHAPFAYSLVVFLCSFAGLAISLNPYLLPPAVTIAGAAASPKTQVFMLTGIGMLPIMLIYNGYQYFVFRGKVSGRGYHD